MLIIIVKYFSLRMKYIGTLLFLLVIWGSPARAQQDVMVRGYVYDSSRMITIPQVKVKPAAQLPIPIRWDTIIS